MHCQTQYADKPVVFRDTAGQLGHWDPLTMSFGPQFLTPVRGSDRASPDKTVAGKITRTWIPL